MSRGISKTNLADDALMLPLDAPLGLVEFPSWWLLAATVAFWTALSVVLWFRNGVTEHFPYQRAMIIPVWLFVILIHLHLSGYGFTPYLASLGPMKQVSTWWGYNWYNANPAGSQAGYNVMYLMHAVGVDLFATTYIMLFSELSTFGALFCSCMGGLSIQIVWEMTEYWSGIQQLAHDPAEMLLRVQHASFTTGAGLFALIPVVLLFLLLHRKKLAHA